MYTDTEYKKRCTFFELALVKFKFRNPLYQRDSEKFGVHYFCKLQVTPNGSRFLYDLMNFMGFVEKQKPFKT